MMLIEEFKDALCFACTLDFWRMAVLWTLSLLLSYFQLLTKTLFSCKPISYRRRSPLLPPSTTKPRLPVCIITGATSGLGAAAAYSLSLEGYFVVLVGRSPNLLSKVMTDIKRRNDNAHLKSFQVDLSSFASILKFKSSFELWLLDSDLHSSVQLLINNAGILATSLRFTAEGFDQMMGTNYLGAFSLTKVLLPLLENSPVPSRIVNVTSFTHRTAFGVQVDKETVSGKTFSKCKRYPCARIYEYSKLCLLLFSYELHRQFGVSGRSCPVSVVYVFQYLPCYWLLLCAFPSTLYFYLFRSAVDPGLVKTNIMRDVPTCLRYVAFLVLNLLGLLKSPESGVCSIVDAALASPEISGVYFFGGNGRTVSSSARSYETKLAKELWATSCDLFRELQLAFKDSSF
ncbi:hypothetical protein RHMOL_Rhmol02G0129700 [Rhododendron molle]|uniref:Uncharacterized protein n=2 Tax=Rhododendron molle TaxID=49168 RepID=A0ACC0PR75_RHOML|nr:hypothetical protein RHMOL_Rhmol02G0129700 [Rhododendron molle]KAI8567530.1 hypothetical protein RHMOL_Rhmol02G0129700 [Rhododendron molle]